MIRRPAIIAVTVAILGVLPGLRAQALPLDDNDANRKDAECFIDKDDVLSPGLSLSPSSGTAVTPEPGTIECHGKVNGAAPTGDGQVTEVARYGTKDPDTCTSGGEGDGKLDISIPTTAGVQTFTAVFTFTYGEPSTRGGVVAGKFQGKGFHGTFDATPEKGDCISAPVTRIHTVDEINFDESFFSSPH
jgi:hypothetical protein